MFFFRFVEQLIHSKFPLDESHVKTRFGMDALSAQVWCLCIGSALWNRRSYGGRDKLWNFVGFGMEICSKHHLELNIISNAVEIYWEKNIEIDILAVDDVSNQRVCRQRVKYIDFSSVKST